MSEGFAYIDILFFAMVAAFIALRLRSVLGRRTGQERRRTGGFERPARSNGAADNVVALPDRSGAAAEVDAGIADLADGSLKAGLTQIRLADPRFDLAPVRRRRAQRLRDDRRGLQRRRQGRAAAAARRRRVQRLRRRDRSAARRRADARDPADRDPQRRCWSTPSCRAPTRAVGIRFASEQVNVVRDGAGNVVEGDPGTAEEVVDIWTFERDTRSPDPNWTLVETRTPQLMPGADPAAGPARLLTRSALAAWRSPAARRRAAAAPSRRRSSACGRCAFERLDGWHEDDPRAALSRLPALLRRARGARQGADRARSRRSASVADWLTVCAAADQPASAASAPSGAPLLRDLVPALSGDRQRRPGGPVHRLLRAGAERLAASRRALPGAAARRRRRICCGSTSAASTPTSPATRSMAGSTDGEFVPYHSRAEIERGALAGPRPRAALGRRPDRQVLPPDPGLGPGPARRRRGGPGRLRDSQNGQPYRAIGRDLIEIGALDPRAGVAAVDPRLAAGASARRRRRSWRATAPTSSSGSSRSSRAADGPLGARGRAAHRRALARGRSPLHAARRRRSGSTPARPRPRARRRCAG